MQTGLNQFNAVFSKAWARLHRFMPVDVKLSFRIVQMRTAPCWVTPDLWRFVFAEDDPVLRLAIPRGEPFEFAEDRRLFYVALTRAKRSALMLTIAHREWPFLLEHIRDAKLSLESATGEKIEPGTCQKCGLGWMVKRSGPAANRFSKCTAKLRLAVSC